MKVPILTILGAVKSTLLSAYKQNSFCSTKSYVESETKKSYSLNIKHNILYIFDIQVPECVTRVLENIPNCLNIDIIIFGIKSLDIVFSDFDVKTG